MNDEKKKKKPVQNCNIANSKDSVQDFIIRSKFVIKILTTSAISQKREL